MEAYQADNSSLNEYNEILEIEKQKSELLADYMRIGKTSLMIMRETKEKLCHHNKFIKVHEEEIYKNDKKIQELVADHDREIKALVECNSRHKIEKENHRQKGIQEENEGREKIEGLHDQKKDLHANICILDDLLAQLKLAQSTVQAICSNDETDSESESESDSETVTESDLDKKQSSKDKLGSGKSKLLKCLENELSGRCMFIAANVKILDGSVIVHMMPPKMSKTFQDYFQKEFLAFISHELEFVDRLDIVWDTYNSHSLKKQARDQRGLGERCSFTEKSKIPKGKEWYNFLKNQDNKTELFQFLSEKIVEEDTGEKQLYSTYGCNVLSSYTTGAFRPFLLAPCTHEEADTRS